MDIPSLVVRHRGWIALAWLVLAGVLIPAARRAESTLEVAARIAGSESAEVETVLARDFASPFAHYAILVLRGLPSPDRPEGRAALAEILADVARVPGVSGTFSYLDARDTTFLDPRGQGTFAVVGLDPGRDPVDVLIPRVRRAGAVLQSTLRRRFPDASLRWTGEAALNYDLRQTSAEQARGAERRVFPITLLLLVVAFGALAAACLPVVTGFVAIPVALGTAVLVAGQWPLSILLVNVVSMVGLGLGIDYGLLTVSRFREAMASGRGRIAAAEDAARYAGHTVLLSGATVAIGFAALLVVPLNEVRSVAVGGLLVVAASVLIATTLLPGLLAMFGERINAGRVPPLVRRSSHGSERRRRWGRWVADRPARVLLLAGAPLLLLAFQSLRLSTALPRGDWLPAGMESARGLHDLEAIERGGIVHTVRLVVQLPDGVRALGPRGWAGIRSAAIALQRDPRIARVQALPLLLPPGPPNPELVSRMPLRLLRSTVSTSGTSTLVELVPREGVSPNELSQLVRELRATDPAAMTGIPGTRMRVGGLPALNADYEDTVAGRFPLVVALVVVATLVALLVGFGSLLVAVKAVILNLLSVAAAFGALVLVFQDGNGAAWLGLDGATGGVFPAVPILVFCTVFGLSMDYEVFLVARVAEARRSGLGETDALAEGLARTAGVITSAAAVMIVVFGAFMLGDFLLIKMLGFALTVAVVVDATVVRLAIGPALLSLAGEWNWWPRGVGNASQCDEPASRLKPSWSSEIDEGDDARVGRRDGWEIHRDRVARR